MKKRLILLFSILLLLGLLFALFFYIIPPIKIVLNGGDTIVLKLGEEYSEPGYKGLFVKEDITSKVYVSGEVDSSKIGEYKVSYALKKGNRYITKERIIKVVDEIKPEINLVGPDKIYLLLNKEYKEYGYKATDNYDNEVSVSVEGKVDNTKVGTYNLKYVARDASGNTSEVVRTIEVVDHSIASDLPVLMYHFFYIDGERPDGNYVHRDEFDKQLKYLVDNNYYFPTWDEVNDYMDGIIALPEKSIVLTFDDGSPSFYDIAYEVAKKYNVPVTAFIITSWGAPNNKDFPLIRFQSHSHDMHQGGCSGQGHGGLFQCWDYDLALADAIKSKEIANDAIVFCYPFGDVNDREVEILIKAGYKMAFTTEWGRIRPGMDKMRLPRIRISGWSSFDYFVDLVS